MNERDPALERAINSGISWNLVISLLGQFANVGITIGLSQMLKPEDYGLLAIALSFSGIIETLGGVGITAAVTQRPKLSDEFLTGVVIILGCSATITLSAMLLLASPLAAFYDQPKLIPAIFALTLLIPINLLQSIPLAVLQRRLLFTKLSFITLFGTLLSGGCAIYIAYLGFSWQALVAKTILFQLLLTICYCSIGWPSFRWKPSWSEIKNILRYGAPQSLTQFLLVLGRRVDDILIGKWIGSYALGIYSMAYSIYLWPITNIKARITQVIFPALTKVQHDIKQVHYFYLRYVSLSVNLGYPVIFGFMAISDLLVLTAMGEKWGEVIPILHLLAIASLFEICIAPGVVFQALARTDLYLKNIFITRGLTIAGIVIAIPFGLSAVGFSIISTSIINLFLYHYFIGKLIPLSNKEVLPILLRGLALNGLMLLTVVMIRWLMPKSISGLVELVLSITSGVLFYIIAVYFFYRALFNTVILHLQRLYKNRLSPKQPRSIKKA